MLEIRKLCVPSNKKRVAMTTQYLIRNVYQNGVDHRTSIYSFKLSSFSSSNCKRKMKDRKSHENVENKKDNCEQQWLVKNSMCVSLILVPANTFQCSCRRRNRRRHGRCWYCCCCHCCRHHHIAVTISPVFVYVLIFVLFFACFFTFLNVKCNSN